MTKLSWWKRSLMVLGVVAAGLAAIAAQPRPGLSAEPIQAPDQKFTYFGSASCQSCHAVSKERPNAFPMLGPYIKFNEFTTWNEEDKHHLAFVRLNGPRGREMAGRLGLDVTKPEAGCLGCHSAGKEELANRQGDQFNPSEGVSCENCHGPYLGWSGPHTQVSFRTKNAKERAALGMVDVRVPEVQATQCLSCHIGDPSAGKVVTHDMYAAGHPPLPSIEVATFSDIIPRHWMLLKEKAAPIRKAAGFQEGQQERTRLAIIGAAVALRTSMKLLADETKANGTTTVPGLDWPDYARFDCWSCHHDLKRDSWRQARGYPASPGRPPIGEWPLAIVELGIERLAMANDPAAGALRAELLGHQKDILGESTAKPFGKKVPLATAAEAFAKWADVLVGKLSQASYDEDVALQLLRSLVAKAEAKDYDYDEARHIGWTIKILAEDAGAKLPNREKVTVVLALLDKGLKLILPAGAKYEIDDQMVQALQAIGDYEPAEFHKNLSELAALIK